MIINKAYIDETYDYLTKSYEAMMLKSLAIMRGRGYSDENLNRDLISLKHYLFMHEWFANYYASVFDGINTAILLYLVGGEENAPYLLGNEGAYLLASSTTLGNLYVEFAEEAGSGIVDKYLVTSIPLVKDILLSTNYDYANLALAETLTTTKIQVMQDDLINSNNSIDADIISSFYSRTNLALEIVFKHLRKSYSLREVKPLLITLNTVEITVYDSETLLPVPGTLLNIYNFNERLVATGVVDDSGITYFDLQPGEYTYTLSKVDYEPGNSSFDLTSGDTEIDFALYPNY